MVTNNTLYAATAQESCVRDSLLAPIGRRLHDAALAAQAEAERLDHDHLVRAAEVAWEKWAEYADTHHRCLQCTRGLVKDYPWADCFDHSPRDHQDEWIAYLMNGRVWS